MIFQLKYLIINRKARGVSPFKSDRRHMHHILLLYFSNKQTVIILFLMSLYPFSQGRIDILYLAITPLFFFLDLLLMLS